MNLFRFQLLLFSLLIHPAWNFASEPGVVDRLAKSEKELQLAEAVFARVQERFENLQKNLEASPEQVLAMEAYVYELSELVKVRQQTLLDLREIAGTPRESPDPIVTEGLEAFEQAVSEVPDAEDPESDQERLDREFLASLESFDGMILDHNRKLEEKLDQRMAKGESVASEKQSAADAAEALLRSMGVDPGTGTEPSGETAGAETKTSGETTEVAGNQETDPRMEAGEPRPTTGAEGSQGQGASRPPRDNDDIVARQLREAAEKETDPVLREKLWKEYEAYLDGQS